jgi:hypothetical protein
VTYQAEKDYIHFNNMTDPESATQAQGKPLSSSSAKVKCLRMRSKCAGILENGEEGVIISLLDLDRLQPIPSQHTLVKLELPYTGAGDGVSGSDSYHAINRCYPKTQLTEDAWKMVVRKAKASKIPKSVSCTMDPELFKKQFVLRTAVGKITECEREWVARGWTIENLLAKDGGSWLWKTNFVDSSGDVKDTTEQGKLRTGAEALEMMRSNLTIRLFDPIGRHELKMHKNGKILEGTNKLELRNDYSLPAMLGKDLFEECQILTDYQWTLLSGPNTGTSIHLDPPFANSWN